jgi:hypothetical protein
MSNKGFEKQAVARFLCGEIVFSFTVSISIILTLPIRVTCKEEILTLQTKFVSISIILNGIF